MFLFEHDLRVVQEFGEANYVRWLDDQNIGVRSLTEARKLVNTLTRSLSSQRLTLNAGKTKFLTPPEVAHHFQLDSNHEIDLWQETFKVIGPTNVSQARQALSDVWQHISQGDHVGVGNWAKILKRMYASSTRVDTDLLEQRAAQDLVDYPELDERICQYFAKRNRAKELLTLFSDYCSAGENLYEGAESVFFESVLLLDPSPALVPVIRKLASEFASGTALGQSGRPLGRSSAILVLYWFGESGSGLASLFDADAARRLPKEVARAWIATVSALRPDLLREVQSRLVGHQSDDVARLSAFLTGLLSGSVKKIGRYKSQKLRWPLHGKYYDARSWLILHIASSTTDNSLRSQLKKDFQGFKNLARTTPEKRLVLRIAGRLSK